MCEYCGMFEWGKVLKDTHYVECLLLDAMRLFNGNDPMTFFLIANPLLNVILGVMMDDLWVTWRVDLT